MFVKLVYSCSGLLFVQCEILFVKLVYAGSSLLYCTMCKYVRKVSVFWFKYVVCIVQCARMFVKFWFRFDVLHIVGLLFTD